MSFLLQNNSFLFFIRKTLQTQQSDKELFLLKNFNDARKSFFTFYLLSISKRVTCFKENSHMFLTVVRDCKRYLLKICTRPKKVQNSLFSLNNEMLCAYFLSILPIYQKRLKELQGAPFRNTHTWLLTLFSVLFSIIVQL